jgi:hypothetical protein
MMSRYRLGLVWLLALSVVSSSCGLLEPHEREEYVIVRANGAALPLIVHDGTILEYTVGINFKTHTFVIKMTSGSLVLLPSLHRFQLFTRTEYLLDGVESPRFPPFDYVESGVYFDNRGAFTFTGEPALFKGRFSGDTLVLSDDTGAYNFEEYEFVRRGSE